MAIRSTQPQFETSPGRSGRALRRVAIGVVASVTFALVAPALANAAGADITNPVTAALRGSVEAVSGAFEAAPAVCRGKAAEKADKCIRSAAKRSATPTPTSTVTTRAGAKGSIVSTVAGCAPRGKDPLFASTGAATSHGHFVRAAAHGDTLALPFGSFDLSTFAGAEGLCAALDAQRSTLPTSPTKPRRGAPDEDGKARDDEKRDSEEPEARPSKASDRPTGKPTSKPTASAERRARTTDEPDAARSAKPTGKPDEDEPAGG